MSRPRAEKRPPPSAPPAADAAPFRLAPWHVAGLLALVHLVLAALSYVPMPFSGGDNGTYLSLARSLLEGTGYREVWDPTNRPHTLYPPVFPVILAGAMTLGLETEPQLKWVIALFSAVGVGAAYLWARRVTTPGIALGTGIALALSPGVLDLTHWVLSDVPFWTFAMLALLAWERRVPRGDGGEPAAAGGAGWLALGVAAVLLAHFTRSAGLPLVAATGGFLLLRRRWRDAAVLAAVLLPAMVAWGMWGRAGGAPGYVDAFRYIDPYDRARGLLTPGDFLARVLENVGVYLGEEVPTALVFEAPVPGLLLGGVFTALAVAGWAMRLRRGVGVAELWIPLHLALVLAWPATWSGARFVLPILPPMLVYAAETVGWLGRRVGAPRAAMAGAAALLALVAAKPLVLQVAYGQRCSAASAQTGWLTCLLPMWQGYFGLAEAMRFRLPDGAVVLARKPTLLHAVSGYRSSLYPLTDRPDSLFAFADSVGAEWVLVDEVPDLAPRYLHPVLRRYADEFCVVTDLPMRNALLIRIDPARTKGTRVRGPNNVRECPLDPRNLSPGMTLPGAPQPPGAPGRTGGQGPGT